MKRILLTIAGYDPSGGAGVLLDTAVFGRFGFTGAGLLTAVTAQNSRRVETLRCLGGRFLLQQHRTLLLDVEPAGIKVGMAGGRENLAALGRILAHHHALPIVVDPVFRSSSGRWLLEKLAIPSYLERIKGKITVLTPNLDEAALISGRRLSRAEEMKEAARRVSDRLEAPCLVKGGHLSGTAVDVLFDGDRFFLFAHRKLSRDVHGTGCLLSSALLCYLVRKKPLAEACSLAVDFTQDALKKAVRLGKGRAVFFGF